MNTNVRMAVVAVLTATATIAVPGIASQVNALITFTANSPAKASEVNSNFTAVKTAVDDNQAQIIALRTELAELKAKLTNVTAVNDYLSLQTVNGQPTVRVSAANFQVVNGRGNTDSNNGTGNLIVGYDELRPDGSQKTCSIGIANDISNASSCASASGVWAENHKSGSHNLIVGTKNNYSSYGSVLFGIGNASVDAYTSVIGGQDNIAGGPLSSVTGGNNNAAWGLYGSIQGGSSNLATGESSTVVGGYLNSATGPLSVVAGGRSNVASGYQSAVSGGGFNKASELRSVVSGGSTNDASGIDSVVSGGSNRIATDAIRWVGGSYSAAN